MATKKTPTKTPAKKPAAASAASVTPKPATAKSVAAKSVAAKPAAAKPVAAKPATLQSVEPVEAAVTASKETVEAVVKAGTQAASKSYEQAVAMAQEQVEKASENLFKGYDEVASLGRDSVDAYVESSTLFAKGVEAMSRELMGFTQSAVEANVANAKALFAAKTLSEVIDLQTGYSRSSFDSLVAESAKITELSMTLASDSMEPLQQRLNVTVEKMLKPLAA